MAGDLLDNRGRGDASWEWPSIHPEGRKFGLIAVAVSLVFLLGLDWEIVGWPLLMLSLGVFAFFRDPERVVPQIDGAIVAPADGRISLVTNAVPPPELALGDKALPRVSIFMSVFDCHVNRSPVAGHIERIAYTPGKFLNADLDKASEDNERNALVVASAAGRVGVVQIAGLIARRIVCWVKDGQPIASGERIGMIRFGSRVDVYLPAGTAPLVSEGQTSLAGETVIAELGSTASGRTFHVG